MAQKGHFTPELFQFLRELSKNNNREWFLTNKGRYETVVSEPFLRFVADFAPLLYSISPRFIADSRRTRGSLFRIYRDVRFSKDKSPYKTHAAAHFPHRSAGKNAHAPGFYLHLEPSMCFAGAGLWRPDSATLTKVRAAIVRDPKAWQAVRRKLELEGDSLSRCPKGCDPDHPFLEDLKRKDFITSVGFTEKQVCSRRFLLDYVEACRLMSPLVQFLAKGAGLAF